MRCPDITLKLPRPLRWRRHWHCVWFLAHIRNIVLIGQQINNAGFHGLNVILGGVLAKCYLHREENQQDNYEGGQQYEPTAI